MQREAALRNRLYSLRWPAIASLITITAILLTSTWWFSRKSKVIPPEKEPEPISVLVADFQNRTGESIFDGALEEALSIGLEGASFISNYKRPNARERANELDPTAKGRLYVQLAQLVCVREGINVVIDGLIEPNADGYNLKVWALDPVNSNKLAEASKTINSKAEVLKAADSIAAKIRSDLGGQPIDSAQAFAKETFSTSSLEAMNAYAHAQELLRQGKDEEAIKEYLSAIKEDPNLGRAYSGLAIIYYNHGQHQESERYFQIALSKIDRMSEREKYRTRGSYFLIHRNFQKAIEEFTSLVERYPADSAGHTNLALAYFFSRNFLRAVEVGHQSIELNPKSITAQYNLTWSALALGDFEMAEQEARKVLEINPEFDEAYVCLALSELGRDRSAQAKETYNQLEIKNKSLAANGLVDLALYEGRLSDAREILERGIAEDLKEGRNEAAAYKQVILAQMLLLLGHEVLALDEADRAIDASKTIGVLFLAAQTYIHAGRYDNARKISTELSNQLEPEPQATAKLIEGKIKLARSNVSEAIELFKESQGLLDTWLCHFSLGRAYLEAGLFTDAYTQFESCLKRRGEATSIFFDDIPSYRYLPPIYYYLGRAQEGLKSPEASESYQKFLEIKEKGERDPLVADARRRLVSL